MLKNAPIRRKLMVIILLTTITVLLLMRGTLLTYEFLRFQQATSRQLSTVGKIIAANSTAALAFANQNDAAEILAALKAEPYISAAALYDHDGKLFSKYPANLPDNALPAAPQKDGIQFEHSNLAGFQPVVQGDKRLGTLYLRFDMGTLKHQWLRISISITLAVIAAAILAAYLLSRKLQQQISDPILALAGTAKAVSDRRDYSVRAKKFGADELGFLTDTFNQMLAGIEERERALRTENAERKQAEERLKASLKEVGDLRAALDEHAIVAMTDPQGRITYVNDKFCAIAKYSREALIGQDHRIINSGHHPKEFFSDLWTTIAQGRVWKGEIKNKARDGSCFWEDSTIVPFLNEDGKPRQYVAIRADITERKRAEEALRKSEAQLQTVVESLDEGVAVSDLEGQLLHFNRAALALHGFASLEESRRRLPEFAEMFELAALDGTIWPVEQWPLARILRGEKLRDLEVRIRRIRTDWQRIFSYGGTLVHDADGRPLMAVVTIRDITKHKQAAEEILQLNVKLEQRVIERTAELEAANKELEAFSYSVSHDLRAPLRAINGFAGIVLEDFGPQLPEEGRQHLERIRHGGQRMGELIDDLLAFSRLSRQSVDRQSVDTGRLVQAALNELKPQRDGRQIEIRVANLPLCHGDPALLKQIWVNLLSNAIKYTRGREPGIVEIGCVHEDGESVYFVRDNGVGFDMQYANKLFGVFQRLHRADEFEGTGVGLAIVQRIVHRHGGRAWAQAEVDRGATFYFTLKGETKP